MVGLKSALFGDMRCFPYWKLLAEYSSVSSEREATKKYSKSVLLPKTTFPLYVEGKSRVDNERYIQKAAGFSSLYEWQRKQSREEEFVLHDGPPYANGQPHIGHSVNKILKDITLRHKLLRGYKVHYIPGWDCHGLPIELKAMVKDNKSKENILHTAADPIAIRAVARKFAGEALTCQRSSFERWGVLADWNNAYTTNNPEYMSRQLHLFADLYERGYIYQAYKPVHFSPSSRTSLAEAELEYVTDHCSPSVYVAFPTNNLPQVIQDKLSHVKCAKAHIAVWTTTPWTLPANEAVCYAENKLYSLVVIKVKEERVAVVWAKELLKELEEFSAIQSELCTFEGSELSGVTYCHPLSDRECPCLPADHVSMTKGTGLVHTAPVHGHEDFLVALRYKIPLECRVDDNGRYDATTGPDLQGKSVLSEGNDIVLQLLSKPDGPGAQSVVLNKGTFIHSYPYDWRTKEPVLIRASKQWFIDTERLKAKALEALRNVQILPSDVKSGMVGMLKKRPYWCISRQRVWGCPIPVFYDAEYGTPIISREIIERVAEIVRLRGADSWWELPETELLPSNFVEKCKQEGKRLPQKGSDILDIWFDSGSSWHCVLGGPSADLYLEGIDQFTGWFQSSLLTSVAVNAKAPYKNLYVHGFTLDEEGKKMSKSLGNVVDPLIITDGGKNLKVDPVYGADVLRWWVAGHVTNTSMIRVGKGIMDNCKQSVQKIRLTLRFLLSCLGDYQSSQHSLPVGSLRPLDQYMLHLLHEYVESVWEEYENYQYHKVVIRVTSFIYSDVSSFYINLVRDRLYCESRWSTKRMSALVVVQNLLHHLLLTLAPILPHLAEEVTLHHPAGKDWRIFHQQTEGAPPSWKQTHLASAVETCMTVRKELYHAHPNVLPYTVQVNLEAGGEFYQALKAMQSSEDADESGLCELLQVSRVSLQKREEEGFTLQVNKSEKCKCLRCRKLTAIVGRELCSRCNEVVASNW